MRFHSWLLLLSLFFAAQVTSSSAEIEQFEANLHETTDHSRSLPIDSAVEHKYVSTIDFDDLVRMVPSLLEPSEWPHHVFALYPLQNEEIQGSGIQSVFPLITTFLVIYKGNDNKRRKLTEIQLMNGVNVHQYISDYCHYSRYEGNDYEDCMTLLRDTASYQLYKVSAYTSTRINATLEDYTLTRTKVLTWILNTFDYKSYLEIGCANGFNFRGVVNGAQLDAAVCVDPWESSLATYHMTSDEYFHTLDNSTTFDMVFIDGLHEAHQAYRDFQNAWIRLNPGGTIIFHDCNPATEIQASYPMDERVKKWNWNGDVWKVGGALIYFPCFVVFLLLTCLLLS